MYVDCKDNMCSNSHSVGVLEISFLVPSMPVPTSVESSGGTSFCRFRRLYLNFYHLQSNSSVWPFFSLSSKFW